MDPRLLCHQGEARQLKEYITVKQLIERSQSNNTVVPSDIEAAQI